MSNSTSKMTKLIYIDEPISGQVVGAWIVITNDDTGDKHYGSFKSKEEALKFATQFDWAKVSPLYWATSNRG